MTINDIKDRVPSNVSIRFDEDCDNFDISVNGVYIGYLYDTPEGIYFKTLWTISEGWDAYANIKTFLSCFTYDLLITFRDPNYNYKQHICRLIK